jgi:pimeloyl-ACP methyl ester carboxylesterase
MKTGSLLFGLIMIFLAACNSPKMENKENHEGAFVHNGAVINYRTEGKGDTTLLFIHGWCIHQNYWDSQVAYFSPKYRVVTIELPTQSTAGKPRSTWTIEEYGKDVAAMIDTLALKNVVLIGHSMGGDVMLEAAVRSQDAVVGLVGIDNFKDVGVTYSPDIQAEIDQFFQGLRADFANVASIYADQSLFHPSTDSLVKERVKNDLRQSDPAIAISVLESLMPYATKHEKTLLGQVTQKLYLLNSDATPTPMDSLLVYAKSDVEIAPIEATGHYPMIEKPARFNQLLEEILGKMKLVQ